MVLLFAHGEEAGMVIVVCYDKRVLRALLSRYGRLKFAAQHVDFWAPYEIPRKYAEMALNDAMPRTVGRDERDDFIVI